MFKLQFYLVLLFLSMSMHSYAQSEIVLNDTIFFYSFSTPEDSVLSSMHIMGSDSAEQIVQQIAYELGEEGMETGEGIDALIPMVKYRKNYDSIGNLILETFEQRDPLTGSWEYYYRKQWHYDKKGRKLQYTRYGYTDNQITNFGSYRYQYKYDSEGNILQEMFSRLDGEEFTDLETKIEYTYDSISNLVLKTEYESSGGWAKKEELSFIYDENSQLIKTDLLRDSYRRITDYFYDGFDRIRTQIELETTGSLSEAVPKAKNEYYYSAEGDTVKKIRYKWEEEIQEWTPYQRKDNILDSLNREVYDAGFVWESVKKRWYGTSQRTEKKYNSNDDVIFQRISYWNDSEREWEFAYYYYISYNPFGLKLNYTVYRWEDSINDFLLSIRSHSSLDTYETEITDSICSGDQYMWESDSIVESGSYKKTFTSYSGRDSICTLNLSFLDIPDLPHFVISGDSVTEKNRICTYSVTEAEGILYNWSVDNGSSNSLPQKNYVEIEWGASGEGIVRCALVHENGCRLDTLELRVLLNSTGFEDAGSEMFRIYPNPARDMLKITGPGDLSYLIMNLQGKVVFETRKKEINIEQLAPGSYFILFKNNSQTILHKEHFIKSR